jgi:hypothetical protein
MLLALSVLVGPAGALENGLIVLNDSTSDRQLDLPITGHFASSELLDLYGGKKTVPIDRGVVKVSIPGKMARIFVKRL